ncbi:MAG: hypothetical protein WCI73_09745 [Phycisphaerae bacterium]
MLADASRIAGANGGIVVAESTSRYIRSGVFNSKTNRNALPSEMEFEELKRQTAGVILATIHHPDLPPKEERRRQTKRGMILRERRGGRPPHMPPGYKKQQRLDDVPKAFSLRREGKSLGEISVLIKRPKSTIQYWFGIDRTNFAQSNKMKLL